VGRIRSPEASRYAGATEDLIDHAGGDPAGKRVLLARVVAADQQQWRCAGRPGHAHLHAVPEHGTRPRRLVAAGGEDRPERLPGEAAETDNCSQRSGDQAELGGEPGKSKDEKKSKKNPKKEKYSREIILIKSLDV